jgi:hypothetical protein
MLKAVVSQLYGARADTIWQVEAFKTPVYQ